MFIISCKDGLYAKAVVRKKPFKFGFEKVSALGSEFFFFDGAVGTGNFKNSVKRTTWYIRKMERLVSNIDNSSRYDFALIVGTMVPGYQLSCPYFVYTDMPILGEKDLKELIFNLLRIPTMGIL